ncbi:ABC exporter membrane fusion protein [Phormidium sp. CLA17]|uniref:ABC exporter membrane fusion protein n=1 Tax=Leptolyngbya sp. Cla-17 TaxID=2803751 RepID=UPI0018D69705|nr:ABC exporter membrane fusion protein [Leptolyngbya sp. Cla-17]MBM0743520.1 ABC exporter membrane fusion protein [Leptolyngbya sp. Cla-17]
MGEKQLLKSPGMLIAMLVAAALGVAGLGIYLALRPSSTSQPGSLSPSPTAEQSANTITALGRLEPEGEVVKVAASSTSGSAVPIFGTPRVARLLVQERSQVKVGQPIAVLDVYDRLMAAALQSQAQVQEAQSRLAQVQVGAKRGDIEAQQATAESRRATVAKLEAESSTAKWEAQSYQNLFREGAISEQEARNRQLKAEATARDLDRAKREYDQALKTLASVAEVRPTDVQQAQAQVNVAMAGMQRSKADLEAAVVRSPITGQIIKVHAREGEQIGGDGLVEIGKTDRMYAVAEIYETDIQKVKRGQKAVITSPAFPGEISGVVDQIGLAIRKNDVLNTDPAANTDVRVVEVKIRLDDSQPVSGLTNLQVKVNITP